MTASDKLAAFSDEVRHRLSRLRATTAQLATDLDGIRGALDVATATTASSVPPTPAGIALRRAIDRAGLSTKDVSRITAIAEVRLEVLCAGARPTLSERAALVGLVGDIDDREVWR